MIDEFAKDRNSSHNNYVGSEPPQKWNTQFTEVSGIPTLTMRLSENTIVCQIKTNCGFGLIGLGSRILPRQTLRAWIGATRGLGSRILPRQHCGTYPLVLVVIHATFLTYPLVLVAIHATFPIYPLESHQDELRAWSGLSNFLGFTRAL